MTGTASRARGPIRPVLTLAAFHGANGRRVEPRVAERLGVPLLDRGILAGVAEQMRVPERAVEQLDANTEKQPRGPQRRYFRQPGPYCDRRGPFDGRVRRITQLDDLDRGEVERRMLGNDRMRIGYVRPSYGMDPKDPDLYHLWIVDLEGSNYAALSFTRKVGQGTGGLGPAVSVGIGNAVMVAYPLTEEGFW